MEQKWLQTDEDRSFPLGAKTSRDRTRGEGRCVGERSAAQKRKRGMRQRSSKVKDEREEGAQAVTQLSVSENPTHVEERWEPEELAHEEIQEQILLMNIQSLPHETVLPLEDPIVTEVTSTLQEWALLWKQLYVVF
ncbi:unnamed protein product [Pleuronectes platessa]|uniref:Dedicator of cytokinesis N-terminal domain-containing protein n=1 Tax=Pleuronectes platessa TaxID=8262 RepID=A0A9N7US03_PLEPL|nr:unnamed protein product [Pleuronectes platessa]